MRTFTAVARKTGNLIGAGLHTTTVLSAIETESRQKTPQLEITVQNEGGAKRKLWFNLMGFKANKKGDYLDKQGRVIKWSLDDAPEVIAKALAKRIEDPEKTDKCVQIVQEFATDCGIAEGSEFTVDDFVDQTVIIAVSDEGRESRVTNTFSLARQDAAEQIMSKKWGYPVALDEEFVAEEL